jgi:hypothetical protein
MVLWATPMQVKIYIGPPPGGVKMTSFSFLVLNYLNIIKFKDHIAYYGFYIKN